MGADNTIHKLAATYIGAARRDPVNRSRILRGAAHKFAELASDPRNAKAKAKLTSIGLDFAGAAMQSQQNDAATQTDFNQLLKDSRDAWEQLGPDAAFMSSATQDAQAIQREVAQGDPGNAPMMSIAPASWNADVTLGRAVTVKYGPTSDEVAAGIHQSQTVAFWQGVKREAQAMTIDIGDVLPVSPAIFTQQDSRPYALIEYGSDGDKRSNIKVDVVAGRRLTVIGNYVSVIVGMDPPIFGNVSYPLSLGASIAAFAAPSLMPVTCSVPLVFQDNGRTDFLQIPTRAARLAPILVPGVRPATANPCTTVNFYTFGGVQICGYSVEYALSNGSQAPRVLDPIPMLVPHNAQFFAVANNTGVMPFDHPLLAQFELSL